MEGAGMNWHLNKTNLSDGNYTFIVYGNDTSDNWNVTETRVVEINTTMPDTTPPTIEFVPPTPKNNSILTVNHTVINITANEKLSTALLEWNGVNETMDGAGMNWYLNKTNLSDGNYTFRVYGNDTLNNWNATETRVIEINTTMPDTTPPVITNVTVTDITTNSARIAWDTDELSDSLVKYGIESGNYTLSALSTSFVLEHSVDLTGLSANTTYYFVVNSTDISNNSNQSIEYSFTTVLAAYDIPYDIKEDAITELEAINTTDKHAQKEIDKAIEHIQKSLGDKLWVDGLHLDTKHGKKVFDEEKKAVKHLTKLCKCKGITDMTLEYNGSSTVDIRAYDKDDTMIAEVLNASKGDTIFINGTTLPKGKLGTETTVKIYDNATGTLIDTRKIHTSCSQPLDEGMAFGDLEVTDVSKIIDLLDVVCPASDIIKKLVQADEVLAKTAVDDAKATPVIDPQNQDKVDREIAKAEEELAKAEDKLNEGKPDKAIDHYKKAWEHAQQAIKHAQKPPKK